jgi:hypothetical protein
MDFEIVILFIDVDSINLLQNRDQGRAGNELENSVNDV